MGSLLETKLAWVVRLSGYAGLEKLPVILCGGGGGREVESGRATCRMGFIIVASLCSEGATAVAVSARDAERGTGRRIFQLLFPELSSNCPMSSHALEALDGV